MLTLQKRGDLQVMLPTFMKIIYNKILPIGKRFYAINLFGVLFAKGPVDAVMLNHEKIHTAQMREMGYIFFYLWYVIEWLWQLIKFRNTFEAYMSISFEREAYMNERDPKYLGRRRRFGFIRGTAARTDSSARGG